MKEITAAFIRAQAAFSPAIKDTAGPRGKYADLSSCIDAVLDALNAQKIGLIQRTHDSDNGVAVETMFIHESGETLSGGILHVPAAKQDPQGYGSALTYARRYSLMAACGIAPEDDDAESAQRTAQKPPIAVPRLTPKEAPKPVRNIEELSVLVAKMNTIADLQILFSNLSLEEQSVCKDIFTVRKNELIAEAQK